MLAKILSAGALTLLLTGGALADQPHKIYTGAQPHPQTSSCKPAFSLPKWQQANGGCSALNARASGSTALHSQRGATSQHNPYAGHRNSTTRHAANPAPYGYRWVQQAGLAAQDGRGQGFGAASFGALRLSNASDRRATNCVVPAGPIALAQAQLSSA
jgi:hypothetical protein